MKTLIISSACLLVFLIIMLQFVQFTVIYTEIVSVEQEVEIFKESFKKEGEVTGASLNRLRKRISEIVKCNPDNISVSTNREENGSLLHCVIRIPMKYLISAAKSLGVEEKVSYYVIDRYVMDMS